MSIQSWLPWQVHQQLRSFHDGMLVRVLEAGEVCSPFSVTNGTKQGCVLAPLLFTTYFSLMLLLSFPDVDTGIPVEYRTDHNLYNLRKLQANTAVSVVTIWDLLFADDCILASHTLSDEQELWNHLVDAARRFGLAISLKKTEVLYQPSPTSTLTPPVLKVGEIQLSFITKFCYLVAPW